MKPFVPLVLVLSLVGLSACQNNPVDEVHECQMFRQCKDCLSIEFCFSGSRFINRYWFDCPPFAPYCNPWSNSCEPTITPTCQALLSATTPRRSSSTSSVVSSTPPSTTSSSSAPTSSTGTPGG